ncbi:DUF5615 family PIN-like protein [Aequorivita marina]|uniref:DUF5615 family PIN-like protein n=1 Tax=Aequorivita marina TaxID=3073654 RepID=UPI002875B206|nr:DUF5615 family PIN-like protein [Aequorivita sp. S2608]MDS1298448.1 DUF5615 family PIN-like protein [Aequorivita sp. S2608]
MKLLFDQNISFRIVKQILENFPDSNPVRKLGLEDCSDKAIWEYAKQNSYTVVTFDADFYDLANLYGSPPKIIWLRFGNSTTLNIAHILNTKLSEITDFIKSSDFESVACLQL